MDDLATLANAAEVISGAVVVGGIGFALVQLRQLRLQRRDTAAMEFMQSVQTPEVITAFRTVLALPDGVTADELRARGPEMEQAVVITAWAFENVGVMVYERMLDLRTVDLLLGGMIRLSWKRVRPFIEDQRRLFRSEPYSEWYQWLAEQLERHGDQQKMQGAHNLYKDWSP